VGRRHAFSAALLAVMLGCATAARADNGLPALPDPATVVVPDLSHSGDPQVVANGWKFFFFRREGVSYAEAGADLADCYRFLGKAEALATGLPHFVAWEDRSQKGRATYAPNPYGLVGAAMLAMFEGTLDRRDRQSRMRRCMETRGYTRYGVAEAVWQAVVALPPAQAIAIQAKIAAGPDFGGKVPEK